MKTGSSWPTCMGSGGFRSGHFAASKLGKNSVGTQQLQNNAVTTAKIKNGAVTGAKVNASSLGTVPNASHAAIADRATPRISGYTSVMPPRA